LIAPAIKHDVTQIQDRALKTTQRDMNSGGTLSIEGTLKAVQGATRKKRKSASDDEKEEFERELTIRVFPALKQAQCSGYYPSDSVARIDHFELN
jgi:hypothetical protein